MYRVRRNFDHWKSRWPWRWFFLIQVNERFCRKCGMPFQDGPMPKELASFTVGDIGVLIYPAGGFRKREYVVRLGRWKASSGRFYMSEFIPTENLNDLSKAIEKLRTSLTTPHNTRAARQ